jgi:hypothetical protein
VNRVTNAYREKTARRAKRTVGLKAQELVNRVASNSASGRRSFMASLRRRISGYLGRDVTQEWGLEAKRRRRLTKERERD